jgi:ectoine hydroxylase-related dioxygenase (phytanoyl-CoA dioxygenase family)
LGTAGSETVDDELVTTFEHEGYIVVEDFFEPQLMDVLDELVRRHFGADPEYFHNKQFLARSKTDVIPWFPQDEGVAAFDAIDADSRLEKLTNAILGDGWRNLYCMVMFSKAASKGQAWHQDCSPDDAETFNLNRLVYTRDITDETGGEVVVVPGSHKRGLLPPGNPTGEFEGQVALRPRKGTLVLLHGHVWHRVLPVKGAPRISTNYRAVPAEAPDDVTDVCVYRNMRYRFSTSQVIEERQAG